MASEITIVKIPREKVYLEEFASLEGVSLSTVRRWTTGPEPVTRPTELYLNGELVSKWDE